MICQNYLIIRIIKMEYFFILCEIVRNQSPQHRQDRIVSIRFKNFLTNNSENLKKLNNKNNICKNIGLSITKFNNKLSDFSDWTFLLNDDVSISRNNVCMGKYLDCKHDEICSTDLNILFSKIQTNNTPVIISMSKNPIVKCVEEDKSTNSHMIIETNNRFSNSNSNATSKTVNNGTSKTVSNENVFKTAHEELIVQKQKTGQTNQGQHRLFSYGTTKRTVGAKYKKPQLLTDKKEEEQVNDNLESVHDDRLRNIDENMIKLICNEIMHKFKPINWEDIAGLEYAKSSIQEAVVWPILRPDIFTGLRRPPRGILLFGPPGTGKTLIGKCIASQSKSTFFSISASSLTSKWIGEGEKMVRALFAVATVKQPSVIFIDEIDSLLCQRTETEHESSRRIKTEFLVQLDGAGTRDNERLLIVGATNRPQELDEAARRRFVRRLYIPLPEFEARIQILKNLLLTERTEVTESEFIQIGHMSEGYSAADMESLCREASMEPIRSIPAREIPVFNEKNVRSVNYKDFLTAFKRVRTSVSPDELQQYEKWNNTFGANNSK